MDRRVVGLFRLCILTGIAYGIGSYDAWTPNSTAAGLEVLCIVLQHTVVGADVDEDENSHRGRVACSRSIGRGLMRSEKITAVGIESLQ